MTRCSLIAPCVCVLTAVLPLTGNAQVPKVGQVQTLADITLSMQVGNTDSETRRVTYAPPPGWYVRGHEVSCAKKSGNVSYSVSATDAHDPNPKLSCDYGTHSAWFPVGTTTVTCYANDWAGNSATGTFTVTVVDSSPPDAPQVPGWDAFDVRRERALRPRHVEGSQSEMRKLRC